jgi:hypothetical protein
MGMINGVRFFVVEATKNTDTAVCVPDGAVIGQILSIVVRYMHRNPDKLHENFFYLATFALMEVWPCKKNPRR